MKYQTKRLSICIALVLLCAFVLPLFGGCAKEEVKTTTAEDALNNVQTENKKDDETKEEAPDTEENKGNGDNMISTPNKGGSQQLTSGTQPIKSAYSTYLEELSRLANLDPAAAEAEVIAARRDLAELTMRTMLTLKWTPKADFEYTVDSSTYVMKAGTTYYGIPYAHGAQSLVSHMLFLDSVQADGTMVMDFSSAFFSGGSTTSRLGCNREDTLVQAWNMISESSFAGVNNDFVPEYGYFAVGGYTIPKAISDVMDDPRLDHGTGGYKVEDGGLNLLNDNSLSGDTPLICAENGEQGMYKAYAALQKADGLVKNSSSGTDAMMVVSVSVVKKTDGTIDGEKSKVVIIKQTPTFSNAVETDNKYVTSEGTFAAIDKEYTFKQLFDETFIPITVNELIDGSPLSAVSTRDSLADRTKYDNIYAGVLTCTRRAAYATHVVYDSKGNVVTMGVHLATQADLRTAQKRFCFEVQKITSANETGRYLYDEEVGSTLATKYKYTKGETYRNVLTLTTVTGETLTMRDYTFVY